MKNIFLDLYVTFAKIGSLTFGGGIAMLPMLTSELIERKKWITDDELLDYYSVGQSTPGIIAVNVATFVGFKKAGIAGGIIATLGIITPSLIIITALAGLINSINDFPMVQKALKGINVAVCALITDATINFAKKTSKGVVSILLMICSFLLIYAFSAPSWSIILGAGTLGAVVYFIKKRILLKNKKENNGIEENFSGEK